MSERSSARLATGALIALVLGFGCAQHPQDTATVVAASPAATPSPAVVAATATPGPTKTASASTPLPAASPSVAPIATSTALVATPSPSAAPTTMLAANAAPEILGVSLPATSFHSGEMITGTVTTSSNVASVEARIATFSIGVPKTGVGRFELSYQVPRVPFFVRGPYTMRLIARNARGDRTERDIPISIR